VGLLFWVYCLCFWHFIWRYSHQFLENETEFMSVAELNPQSNGEVVVLYAGLLARRIAVSLSL
jgi:hypothetical protein